MNSTGDIGLKTTSNQIVLKTVCSKSSVTNNNNKTTSVVDLNLIHANKGIEALGVLIQHLVFNVSTLFFYLFYYRVL